MSVIIIPRKHLQQPQGRVAAAPDWADGLLVLQRGQDLVVGTATVSGAPSDEPAAQGLGWRGGAGKWFSAPAQYKPSAGKPFSVVIELESRETVSNGNPAIFSFGNSTDSGSPALLINASAFHVLRAYWAGNYQISVLGGITSRLRMRVVFTYDGSVGRLYLDGAEIGSAVGWGGGEANNWYFGAGFQAPLNAVYFAHAQWSRALHPAEVEEVSRNPWQLFRADPLRIYSFPAGAITLNSLTMSAITQTTARATLSVTR